MTNDTHNIFMWFKKPGAWLKVNNARVWRTRKAALNNAGDQDTVIPVYNEHRIRVGYAIRFDNTISFKDGQSVELAKV